ncbi:alpha/beta hydrolase [Arthrobacter sp. zg-Y1219]|uniref:alpha/beta hydrolase n=1 Tax=Arthrobacter sp. zg-Y1219 TaxID=3049067 RepID=UPI0024C3F7AB|nr:alpha/beta hydrolase [Arthrobacter sp. zg-Y1219]MDK1360476.1 alpha/beta hydrolase [Arthrobacter sp. zg-Y1219]
MARTSWAWVRAAQAAEPGAPDPKAPGSANRAGRSADPAEFLRSAESLKRFSRRRFLAGSALGLTLAADLFVTRRIQRHREDLEILRVRDEAVERRFPTASWFLFPGYKTSWEETVWILNSLRPALSSRGQLAGVGYSNRGLDVDDIVAAVYRHIRTHQLRRIYFYGHSFGGMLAVQVAARLLERGIAVELIILDSSPAGAQDVLDRAMFEGVAALYDAGYRIPSVLRGGYELGERVLHKDERTWNTVVDQTLEQLSPLAPSSTLIQSEASYIFHFDAWRFASALGSTSLAFIGNPEDRTVNYFGAKDTWAAVFPRNLVSASLVTEGAGPAHASPQWNPGIYQKVVREVLRLHSPPEQGGGLKSLF